MARYQKVLPLMDTQNNTYGQIQQLLIAKGYKQDVWNYEQVFRKGDGFWTANRFIKVFYFDRYVQVEAWIDSMGSETDLSGFYGWAVKGKMRKEVALIEQILSRPGVGYVPQQPMAYSQTQETYQAPPVAQAAEHVQPVPDTQATFCAKCATPLVIGGKFCPKCGHPAGAPFAGATQPTIPVGIDKKTYFKEYAGDSFRKGLRVAGILGYICAGINAIASIFLVPLGIVDSLIFLGLTLGMHLGKSKVCAWLMLGYAIFSAIVGLVLNGQLAGWLWIVAGVNAVVTFANAEKRYKELTGQV